MTSSISKCRHLTTSFAAGRAALAVGAVLALVVTFAFAQDQPRVEAELVAEGMPSPVLMEPVPGADGRAFLVDQTGLIWLMEPDGTLLDEPFLDLSERIVPLREGFEERGLLGVAAHPDYARNGRLYVHYSAPLRDEAPDAWDHTAVVSEFTVPADAERADPGSERRLLEVDHPNRKTNAGALAFGPDGLLYVAMGEGGGAHGVGEVAFGALEVPERGNVWDALAQDLDTLFGKILRIDVDRGWPGYGVPDSNPFVGRQGRDEIYAWGFRNHYRMAFDEEGDGALYVAAVSESLSEAVYKVTGPGNYGWPIREGTRCYDRQSPLDPPDDCPAFGPHGWPIMDPVVEYFNANVADSPIEGEPLGTAIVGGYVYRGRALPELQGRYVFADYSADPQEPSGTVFSAGPEGDVAEPWPVTELVRLDARAQGMGRDGDGELYVLTREAFAPEGDTGRVYRLVAADADEEDAEAGAPADGDAASGEGGEAQEQEGAASDEGAPAEAASDAVYTAEQAERGAEAYLQHCQACHGAELRAEGPFPSLTGPSFFADWGERTLDELFAYTHANMPLNAPGSLEDETYADLMAHWLSFHGYAAGDEPLPPDEQAVPAVPVEDRR